MAVTINEPVEITSTTWLLTWSSSLGSPTYRIYRDGVLVSTQTTTEYTLTISDGYAPVIEILDDATEAQPAFPGVLVLGWRNDADAAQYKIEEYAAGVWVLRETVVLDSEVAWQSYTTPALADETSHTWRVTPVDAAGNSGTAISFVVLMVRHPDVPDVLMTYSSGTAQVTVSAA